RSGRVAFLDVLGQHEDADLGPAGADRHGGAEAVVGVGGRHADVDDAEVGAVALDDLDEALGVADGGDDLVAGVVEEADEPGPQQHRVLGDHDPHGSSTSTVVGPPGGLLRWKWPESAATRLPSPASPVPDSGSAPPTPSSRTSMP